MSTATTRRLARLERASGAGPTRLMLAATDQAKADTIALEHSGALIIMTGVPRAPRGVQA
jgi:hypothetical protein